VLAAGGSLVLLPKFASDEVLRWLPVATVMMGVPTFYTRLLQRPELSPQLTGHLRGFICGSAPLPMHTHAEFQKRTGHTIVERYGMTELLIATANSLKMPIRLGSVGLPLPSVDVRIRSGDSGKTICPVNQVGAIELRSPSLSAGYWRDAEMTQASFRPDGFFVTGDLGRVDADGHLYISGRASDMVISGGYNVYPLEIENELDDLTGVLESAVFGLPHPDFGEGVTAVVKVAHGFTLSQAEVLEALSERLANYKVPKRVLFVEEIPRNALGKVRKDTLRQSYADLYC
jgi:malonyl-CoA/methylmalonyl-CoA synthetase